MAKRASTSSSRSSRNASCGPSIVIGYMVRPYGAALVSGRTLIRKVHQQLPNCGVVLPKDERVLTRKDERGLRAGRRVRTKRVPARVDDAGRGNHPSVRRVHDKLPPRVRLPVGAGQYLLDYLAAKVESTEDRKSVV